MQLLVPATAHSRDIDHERLAVVEAARKPVKALHEECLLSGSKAAGRSV